MASQQNVPEQEISLIEAITGNNLERAVELLNQGVSPDVRNAEGATALMIAAKHGYIELAKILLTNNADVDAEKDGVCGQTALKEAVQENNLAMVNLLLETGADVNVDDINRETVIFYAIERDQYDIVRSILETGTYLQDIHNRSSQTALHFAVWNDQLDMIRVMLEAGASPLVASPDNHVPLMSAGSPEIVDLLLRAGADPNSVDDNGQSCLHWAIREQNAAVASSLVHAGADTNYEVDGKTPLFHALTCWMSSTVEDLVDHGADVTATNRQNRGVLYYAAAQPDPFICQYLIAKGGDPDLVAIDGTTPVYIAVSRHHTEVAKVLLAQHVSLKRTYRFDNTWATLLDIAIEEHLNELSNLLYDLGCPVVKRYPLDQQWPEGIQNVLDKLNNPRQLQAACRIVLWRHFNRHLQDYLSSFVAVPKSIVEDILMTRCLS